MADELDQTYMRTRQAMRNWQGQMFEDESLGSEPKVEPTGEGTAAVHMGLTRGMKPQEGGAGAPTAQPTPPDIPRTRTALPPEKEPEFQQWYAETAKQTGLAPDPDDPKHKYDYRGFYQSGRQPAPDPTDLDETGKPRMHFSSEFKDDDHPNRFVRTEDGKILDSKNDRVVTPQQLEAIATPEQASKVLLAPYEKTIQEEAAKNNLDPNLLRAVAYQESRGKADAVSPKGATGLMQLMPDTAKSVGVTDAKNAEQNIAGGAKQLAKLIKQYDGDTEKALAAYNFGPGNVAKGRPLPKETKNYIKTILSLVPSDEMAEAAPTQAEQGAVGITPRREFTVDTPEMQQVKEDWRQKFAELTSGETPVKELGKVGKQVAEAVRPGFEVAATAIGLDEEAAATVGTAFVEFMGGLPGDEQTDFAAGVETLLAALPAIAGVYKVGKTVGGAAVEGILKNKEAILKEFEKAWAVTKGERGSVPLGIAGPAEEPLSSKELALLSKREESRQNYGFKVEGFEEELTKQRRGPVLSDEAVQKLAAESGFTLEDLMYLKPGSILAPEIQLAARGVYRAAAERMTTSAKMYLAKPTPENMNDFAESFTQAGLATTRIIGTFAESGRTMRLLNQKVPGLKAAGEAQARDPEFRIQDAYIKQMYEFFRQAESKSKMGGFAGPAGQAAQPGVITSGQLAQMVVELPSEEAAMNFAKAAIKPTWSDMLYEVWINGLLSAPVTHATNIISNAATIAWNIPERAVASMLHPKTVRPGEASAMMGGVMESMGDAWRLAWKAFREDAPQFGQSKLEMPQKAITADAFDFTGNVGRAVDYLGVAVRLPGRFLMAADDFFKAIAFRAELRALAKRESFKQVNELGLTGKEASKTIKEIEHRILADPPEYIKEAAQDFAAYTTFTRELGETGTAIQHAIYATPMGRVVVPFIRTPANIFKFAGERTPLALASRAVRDELAAGGERAALAQAKIALGSMTMGFMGMLAANGMITGGGPKDKALRKQWEDGGWKPYSFKIGNEYISYARIEPLGSLIGMAADATEIIGQLDERKAEELAAALTVAISRNVANKTFVKGLSGTLNAVTSQDVNVVKGFLEKELPTILPYSSALGQTAKLVDPIQREVSDILDAVKAKVPGWSETLQAERNLWGEILPVRTAIGPDFLSPFYSSTYKDDKVINEMNRLEKAFTVPSRNVGGLKYGSDDLPNATYWRYVELSAGKDNLIRGMNLHDKIEKTITAPMYGMATKDGQIAYIQADIDLFRATAMLRLRKEDANFDKAMLRQDFKEKTKKSAATQERVLAAPRLQ